MDDLQGVERPDRLGHLPHQSDRLGERHSLTVQVGLEGVAFHPLHGEKGLAFGRGALIDVGHDARLVQAGQQATFLGEAQPISLLFRPKDLDRNQSALDSVLGSKHGAHGACTHLGEQQESTGEQLARVHQITPLTPSAPAG